jgi:hypothetical protein
MSAPKEEDKKFQIRGQTQKLGENKAPKRVKYGSKYEKKASKKTKEASKMTI